MPRFGRPQFQDENKYGLGCGPFDLSNGTSCAPEHRIGICSPQRNHGVL